ncbi:MAG: cytochrome c1 [Proteobacteria bacterium]|nr:cytochrome c1 [Pseudomonadota bacterium]MDA1058736.1 cytochrome c1 [Pseudomonadota bacterium]
MTKLRGILTAAAVSLILATGANQVSAAEAEALPPAQDWSFNGLFGTFDRAALQRGYKVYKDVCASCHAMKYVAFRNLVDIGFTEGEAKALAEEYEVAGEPDEFGDPTTRKAALSDIFPAPYQNPQAARAANSGALPPDLSLITKAREHGPDYIRALMVGYEDAPADMTMGPGMNYNVYFPGHQVAMPAPLSEGMVEYADGTEASVEQMAEDVTTFLHWAANPELERRHQIGFQVMVYLILLTGLFLIVKQRVWRKLDH